MYFLQPQLTMTVIVAPGTTVTLDWVESQSASIPLYSKADLNPLYDLTLQIATEIVLVLLII